MNSNEPIIVDTEVTRNEGSYPSNEVVTLRIRTEAGKRTLIVKLHISDKISTVYQIVKPYIENRGKPFEIRTNFPKRAYEESDIKNLKELGLAPSSALVIQLK